MSGLKVIAPGAHTTIQDLGRYGYQAMGVPVSGALDTECLRLANALVGNSASDAGIEVLYHGPLFEVHAGRVRIAVCGAGATIDVLGETPRHVEAWRSISLQRGEKFQVTPGGDVSSCYLAIAGGFDLDPCLGSLSTYTRAGFGGFRGRALQAGDEIPLILDIDPQDADRQYPTPPVIADNRPIRVVWGLQKDYFTDESITAFESEPFRILTDADRMGYRIDGPDLTHRAGYDIVSDGIATGSIQVPGSGQPIILLADHQTTGGYPKIATVISADLPALGRRRPGDEIRFQAIDIAIAEKIRRDRETNLRQAIQSLEPADQGPSLDVKALYESNLISGVAIDPDRLA